MPAKAKGLHDARLSLENAARALARACRKLGRDGNTIHQFNKEFVVGAFNEAPDRFNQAVAYAAGPLVCHASLKRWFFFFRPLPSNSSPFQWVIANFFHEAFALRVLLEAQGYRF